MAKVWCWRVFVFCSAFIALQTRAQDPLPVVNIFRTGFFNVGEGARNGEITVTKDRTNAITVHLELAGTAIPGTDYYRTNTVFLSSTDVSRALPIWIYDDNRPETNETIVVRILPDSSYSIGPLDTVSFTLLDNDPFGLPNRPPSIYLFGPSNNPSSVGSNIRLAASASDYDGDVVSVDFFNGMNLFGSITNAAVLLGQFGRVSVTESNLAVGVYDLFARATDDAGATADSVHQTIYVGSLPPFTSGSVRPDGAVSPRVSTWFDSEARTNAAIIKYEVPSSFTNCDGFLNISIKGPGSAVGAETQVYIYEANGAIASTDLAKPLTYVRSFSANEADGCPLQVNLTPWIGSYLGKTMGIQFRTDSLSETKGPTDDPSYDFSDALLVLAPTGTYDAPPRIQLALPQNNLFTLADRLDFKVGVSDPDRFPAAWNFSIDRNLIATGDFAGAQPGTNLVQIGWTNVTLGWHQIQFTTLDATGKVTTATAAQTVLVVAPNESLATIKHLGLTGGSKSFYVLDAKGRAQVWGYNPLAQLGLNYLAKLESYNPLFPSTVAPPSGEFRQIAAGANHAIALTSDGTIYGWGSSSNGVLYANAFNVQPFPVRIPQPTNVLFIREIAASDNNNFVLDHLGRAWIWGRGYTRWTLLDGVWEDMAVCNTRQLLLHNGQLFTTNSVVPFPEGVTNWTSFTVTDTFALAIGNDGQLYGWGQNDNGQLPLLPSTNIAVPTKANVVAGVTSWKRVLASPNLTLALDARGQLYAWGNSPYVANSAPVPNQPTPVQFPKGAVVCVDMSVTTQTAMALGEHGEVFAWGHATQGIWQDPSVAEAFFPEPVRGLENILDPTHASLLVNFLSTPQKTQSIPILGARGFPYIVQASTDLANWTTYATFSNPYGVEHLQIPNAPDAPASQFFRIHPTTP